MVGAEARLGKRHLAAGRGTGTVACPYRAPPVGGATLSAPREAEGTASLIDRQRELC